MIEMAKRKGVNKSAEVRAILAKEPKTPVKEIVATLAARGLKISPNLVYLIKSKSKSKARRARRQQAMAMSASAGIANPVQLILEVRQLAGKAGGIKHLKALVDVLAG